MNLSTDIAMNTDIAVAIDIHTDIDNVQISGMDTSTSVYICIHIYAHRYGCIHRDIDVQI